MVGWQKTWRGKGKKKGGVRLRTKKSTLNKIKKDVKKIKKQLSVDRGLIDTVTTVPISNQSTSVYTPFQTQQGDAANQREGNQIIAKSVHIKGLMKKADSTNIVRLLAAQFDSAADESFSAILQQPYGTVAHESLGIYSPYTVNGDCKFRVLADKTYQCNEDEAFKRIDFTFKIPQKFNVMKYSSDGTSNDSPATNSIRIFAVSDSVLASHPELLLQIRQRYVR